MMKDFLKFPSIKFVGKMYHSKTIDNGGFNLPFNFLSSYRNPLYMLYSPTVLFVTFIVNIEKNIYISSYKTTNTISIRPVKCTATISPLV